MDAKSRADAFIHALTHAEALGDPGPLIAMFHPEAELSNPSLPHPARGLEGAKEFWTSYLATFRGIRSEFRLVLESDQAVVLEWTSRGRGADGVEITYDGVSVVEFEGDSIRRFRAYFDPRALGAELQGKKQQAA